jgi:outer membrane protein
MNMMMKERERLSRDTITRFKVLNSMVAISVLSIAFMGAAFAQDNPWTLRVGPAGVTWNESSKLEVAGAAVPGAKVELNTNYTLGVDVGYDLSDRWTMHLGLGIPPKAKLTAAGSLDALVPPLSGKLGQVRYGPILLSPVFKFNPGGRFDPYLGAGVTYVHVFSTADGDVANLNIHDAWGAFLQAGFSVALKDRWSYFLDVRKLFLNTSVSGTLPALGGPPVALHIDLDPLIVHTGIEYRF